MATPKKYFLLSSLTPPGQAERGDKLVVQNVKKDLWSEKLSLKLAGHMTAGQLGCCSPPTCQDVNGTVSENREGQLSKGYEQV